MDKFNYIDERFADIQILRYQLHGFDSLNTQQKALIFYLSQATLWGRDITTDQFGKYNLRIRKTLEAVYLHYKGNKESNDFKALTTYLKQVWFANGIHHHYGGEKFTPLFSEQFFKEAVNEIDKTYLPLDNGCSINELLDTICPLSSILHFMLRR